MPQFIRPIYTVCAECGVGEFLWVAHEPKDGLAGANVFSLMDCAEDQNLISEGLFVKFSDWAHEYMQGQPTEWGMPWGIKWESFNTRGIQLARMLKEELGSTADVRYLRADHDPNGIEVLLVLAENDG